MSCRRVPYLFLDSIFQLTVSKIKSCQVIHLAIILVKIQFSNALRLIEMGPVLKKLKAWTLYVHIVAQVNHRSFGVKVER